jgi:hypothetical protein
MAVTLGRTDFAFLTGDAAGIDAEQALDRFRQPPPLDWSSRGLGGAAKLYRANENAVLAQRAIQGLATMLKAEQLSINLRANNAGANVFAAVGMVQGALLLHLHSIGWHDNNALILLRTALDLVARAAFIADRRASEATQWERGANVRAVDSYPHLGSLLTRREPGVSDPHDVYEWLCSFSHFDSKALLLNHTSSAQRLKPDDVYAALAYVAWACAVLAEVITGVPDLAVWPDPWPVKLPWS